MHILRRPGARWGIPFVTLGMIVGISSVAHLVPAGAQIPNLPPLTAAELLVKVSTAKVPPFSGVVKLTAHLGLPDLGSFGASIPGSITDLLSGTHTAEVAADGPTKVRVMMAAANAESSWVRNGTDAWSWSSASQTAQHATFVADNKNGATAEADSAAEAAAPPVTPADEAKKVLAAVDPTTSVSVRTSAYVAGRAAYELVLSPKSPDSTVADIVLAVDAATGTPLDVRITAKGSSTPALEIGFTSVTFGAPAASTFVFTAPPGVSVTEVASPADLLPFSSPRHGRDRADRRSAGGSEGGTTTGTPEGFNSAGNNTTMVGTGWESVAVIKGTTLSPQIANVLSGGTTLALAGGGKGRLVSTALVNVLLSDDGRIAVGAVNSATLVRALAPAPAA